MRHFLVFFCFLSFTSIAQAQVELTGIEPSICANSKPSGFDDTAHWLQQNRVVQYFYKGGKALRKVGEYHFLLWVTCDLNEGFGVRRIEASFYFEKDKAQDAVSCKIALSEEIQPCVEGPEDRFNRETEVSS